MELDDVWEAQKHVRESCAEKFGSLPTSLPGIFVLMNLASGFLRLPKGRFCHFIN
jgi:hypothetical protein